VNRSPIVATVLVVAFGVGVPVALILRLAEGILPTQPYDIVLGVAVLAWIFIARAILDRDTPMSTLVENRLSPSRQAHSLVEQSLFGVGFTGRSSDVEPSPRIHRLQSPLDPIESLLPPPSPGPRSGRIRGGLGEERHARLHPTLHRDDAADPPFPATEDYIVQRGDTFWSIAEQRLGDGRHWKAIERVNLGRQVAPGIELRPGNTLCIGWSVLVPRAEESAPVA